MLSLSPSLPQSKPWAGLDLALGRVWRAPPRKGGGTMRRKQCLVRSQELESWALSFWLPWPWMSQLTLSCGFHIATCRADLSTWFPNPVPKLSSASSEAVPGPTLGSLALPAGRSSPRFLSRSCASASCHLNKAVTGKWKLLGGLISRISLFLRSSCLCDTLSLLNVTGVRNTHYPGLPRLCQETPGMCILSNRNTAR